MSAYAEFYLQHEYAFAGAQLALAMLGMGATVQRSDFLGLVRRPLAVAVGLALQLVAAPLLAAGIVAALGLTPGLAVGLFLIAAVPGGTFSNLFTYFARGNLALSIALTAITTLACLATTPLVLRIFASEHLPAGFEMPTGKIASEIAYCLLGPLGIGMIVGAIFEAQKDGFARWCIRGSMLVVAAIIVGSGAAGRIDPTSYGWAAPAALAAFAICLQLIATATGFGLRLPRPDRIALAVEVTIRNANLALLVKASILPARPGVVDPVGDGVFFMALLYGGFAMFVAMVPLVLGRRGG